MTPTKLAKMAEKLVVDNAPAILTGVGVVGTAATAYFTAKSTFKAAQILEEEKFKVKIQTPAPPGRLQDEDPLSKTDKVKLVWKLYILPAGVGVSTIAAILYANRISTKRAAALAAAYALSQDRFSEYKEKMSEKLGVKKEQSVTDELAQDRINANPPQGSITIIGDGKVLCKDEFTGRYFQSTVEKIKRAQNEINAAINDVQYSTLSEFYEKIGLPPTSVSETFGWNSPDQLDMSWSTVLTPDGTPCVTFDVNAKPVKEYGDCAVR